MSSDVETAPKPDQDQTQPEPQGMFGVAYRLAGMIEYLARHDLQTGMLNKAAVRYEGQERIDAGEPFGVLMLDWDAFKRINDGLGHEVADRMLERFGPYVAEHFRREGEVFAHEKMIRDPEANQAPDYLFGRYGGDEFIGLVNLADRNPEKPDGLTVEQRMAKAEAYARGVLTGFVEEQDSEVRALDYDISVGSQIWVPGGPQDFSDVIHAADVSLREDKQAHSAPVR
jgi:GGDEF domain-containing protein